MCYDVKGYIFFGKWKDILDIGKKLKDKGVGVGWGWKKVVRKIDIDYDFNEFVVFK